MKIVTLVWNQSLDIWSFIDVILNYDVKSEKYEFFFLILTS